MQSTRQAILAYLEDHHTASALQLSRALQVTPANVRHHLKALRAEGSVELTRQDIPAGRGRPTLLYTTARRAQTHNLIALCDLALAELMDDISAERRTDHLKKLARRLSGDLGAAGGALPRRLIATVQRLNLLHYKARWEAHADAPRIILEHCPYAAIIEKHPELCQMDAHLIEELAALPAVQRAKQARSLAGPPQCIFVLQPRE